MILINTRTIHIALKTQRMFEIKIGAGMSIGMPSSQEVMIKSLTSSFYQNKS
jgi:hypothetical protein